ncbi:hypothetical protein V496_05567 [Pseudogymnoascus sp. VKM F-4515 (FW-2607)]|nr:hypothetical protein V496_05567 [Pseudogymnoascus sp. VKM F-4515 (FW-2607)]
MMKSFIVVIFLYKRCKDTTKNSKQRVGTTLPQNSEQYPQSGHQPRAQPMLTPPKKHAKHKSQPTPSLSPTPYLSTTVPPNSTIVKAK